AYSNWRITGSALDLPYAVNSRRYASTPVHWIAPEYPKMVRVYRDDAMRRIWEWDANVYYGARRNPMVVIQRLLNYAYPTFIEGAALPLILIATAGWFFAPRGRFRVASIMLAVAMVVILTEKNTQAHYLAPQVPLMLLITVSGFRWLRALKVQRQRVGGRLIA